MASPYPDAMMYRFSFPQVQGIHVKQLIRTLLTSEDSAAEDMIEQLQAKVSSLSGVRLERSADTLGALWEGISKGKVAGPPVEKESSPIPIVSLGRPRFNSWLRVCDRKTHYKRSEALSGRPCFIQSTRELSWITNSLPKA